MKNENQPDKDNTVTCKQCMKEVPAGSALSAEAVDYVVHFCGLECYDKWKAQNPSERT